MPKRKSKSTGKKVDFGSIGGGGGYSRKATAKDVTMKKNKRKEARKK